MNHISHLDPMTLGWFLYEHGRLVRYLAKEALWHTPLLKYIVKDAGQIPVARMTEGAASAFDAAVEAVHAGECIGVYPEGTITKDPDGWPMRGKTGAARIALATGCPVIPIGQWGAQDILPAYSMPPARVPAQDGPLQGGRPGRPRATCVDKPLTNEVLHEATDRIMAAITALVEDLRGETAPAVRFDPKTSGVERDRQPEQAEAGPGMTKVAVFGAGSWGTAFSLVLADAGQDVTIWGRRPEVCEAINERHENTEYFPGIELPAHACGPRRDPEEAAAGAEFVVLSMPSQKLRENLGAVDRRACRTDAVFVSLMKGVELGTTKRMSEVIAEVTGAGPERICVVSGPNLAREIALREPAASVVACEDETVAAAAAGPRATPRRSAPTAAPTCSAASSAAPTRTSSRCASGWRSGSASATTPRRR